MHFDRDSQGYLTSSPHRLHTPTRALVSDTLDVQGDVPRWVVDKVRVRATGDRPLFVGIARQRDLAAYLRGVPHATVEDFEVDPFGVDYVVHAGGRAPAAPTAQRIWAASVHGAGRQDLRWRPRSGR